MLLSTLHVRLFFFIIASSPLLPSFMLGPSESTRPLLAVCVGNTRTRFGRFERAELLESHALANDDPTLVDELRTLAVGDNSSAAVVLASVNDPVRDRLIKSLDKSCGSTAIRLGVDLPIPLKHTLADASTLGQDRALNALAAYARTEQACVVIDVGTAVTVDFVDGTGTFHGGAIAPGVRMMLCALNEHTAALPEVAFDPRPLAEGDSPFGKDTPEAMLKGAAAAVRGMVRELIERYAQFYEAYPQIIATGGDALTLFGDGDLVEHIVPDLQLLGVHAAVADAINADPVE